METNETIYRPIASVDQIDIEFVIPGDGDKYVDLDFILFVKGKLQTQDNADLPETDYTAVVNNLLHSLFSQCTIYLNGTQNTQATGPLSNFKKSYFTSKESVQLPVFSHHITKL